MKLRDLFPMYGISGLFDELSFSKFYSVQEYNKLPKSPAIFIITNETGHVLFIGRSSSLQSRMGNQFRTKENPTQNLTLKEKGRSVTFMEVADDDDRDRICRLLVGAFSPSLNPMNRNEAALFFSFLQDKNRRVIEKPKNIELEAYLMNLFTIQQGKPINRTNLSYTAEMKGFDRKETIRLAWALSHDEKSGLRYRNGAFAYTPAHMAYLPSRNP
jgi:hypothetical protein